MRDKNVAYRQDQSHRNPHKICWFKQQNLDPKTPAFTIAIEEEQTSTPFPLPQALPEIARKKDLVAVWDSINVFWQASLLRIEEDKAQPRKNAIPKNDCSTGSECS